jgi:hypothetical protein
MIYNNLQYLYVRYTMIRLRGYDIIIEVHPPCQQVAVMHPHL